MRFLELPADSYEKHIVKLNVNRIKRDEPSEMDRFVFVFSRCIEDSSTYGKVHIELVPESKVPIFHDKLVNAKKREIKDEDFDERDLDGKKSVEIGKCIKIIKNVSDFAIDYIAVVHDQNGQLEYYGLLSKNRGLVGRLENRPKISFAPEYLFEMCKYKNEEKKVEIENSVRNIKELEGLAETFEDIVSQLEAKKSKVENRETSECLRSFYQS